MKMNSRKRSPGPWILIITLCIVITTCLGAYAASDSFYPGPTEKPKEPVVVITPKPTPEPTPKPTPKPTPAWSQKPWWQPTNTPEPREEEEGVPFYNLTVYYRYPDGSDAALPYEYQFKEGEEFEIMSPWVPNHLVSVKVYSGKMPGRDHSFVVWYYKSNYVILEDYDTPLGLGNVIINIGDCYE